LTRIHRYCKKRAAYKLLKLLGAMLSVVSCRGGFVGYATLCAAGRERFESKKAQPVGGNTGCALRNGIIKKE
jgi:hypothetical protein